MSDKFSFNQVKETRQKKIALSDWLPLFLLSALMLWTSQINLLMFHTLAELVAIFIAIMAAVVCWHMYRFSHNDFLLYLGCAYFWIALLDLMHTFAYKGMPIFNFESANPSTQLWIVTRYIEALALLSAPLFIRKKINAQATFAAFAGTSILFSALIMTGNFPTMFIEGQGLTAGKVISEYIIIVLLGLAIAHLLSQRNMLAPKIITLLVTSIVLTMAAEMAFTFYVSIYDVSLLAGHFLKVFSYWAIYLAIVETSMRHPFQTMSRGANIYDSIPEAIVTVDEYGIIRQTNETAATMAVANRERLIGQHCHAYFHSPDEKSEQCFICHHIASQHDIPSIELYNGYKKFWTEITLSAVDPSGHIKGMTHTIRDISKRKAIEIELEDNRTSLAYFRSAIDETTDSVYLIDPETMKFIDSNKIGWISIGYTLDELLKLNVSEISHSYNSQELKDIFNAVIDNKSTTEITTQYIRKDGSIFNVEVRLNHFYANNKDMITALARDITERLKTEQELKESKQRIQEIIDNMPGIVFQYSLDAEDQPEFEYISAQITKMFGIAPEAAISDAQIWINAMHPDDIHAMNESIKKSKENLSYWNWEGRGINQSNNNTIWFHATSQPRKTEDGKTVWNGILSDITDIKQAQQTLIELNNIINRSTTIAFLWRNAPDWPVEYVSDNIKQFGYSPDDFYSNKVKFSHIIHPDDIERVANEVKEFSQQDATNNIHQQYRILDKNGVIRWTDDQTWVRRNEKGDVTHYQGVVLDISERKKIEIELQNYRENLELRIWERTKDLAKARDEALHANEVKSEFLANISHELRTPLNSIIGFTGVMKDGLAGEINHEQKKQLTIVDDSAKHLLLLINDILDLSKIEANKSHITAKIFNPKLLLADIINMVTPLAVDKGLTLESDFCNCPQAIHTDAAKLKQIILNLVSNAVKFTKHGGVTLNCSQKDKYFYLNVIDTGYGIKDSDIDKIFDAFTQADNSSTREHPGTGLGLSISRKYAHMMGGDITVKSIYGKGSHFTLAIPAHMKTNNPESPANPSTTTKKNINDSK